LDDFLRKWAKVCGDELNIDPSDSLDDLLNKVDANSDGKLSLEEFIPLFDQMVTKSGIWG
jgi:Ca2+-binding EF-hand superfamily protein